MIAFNLFLLFSKCCGAFFCNFIDKIFNLWPQNSICGWWEILQFAFWVGRIMNKFSSIGVFSNRQAWWQTLHANINFNVETNNITLLVPLVEKLAKSSILTLTRKIIKKSKHVNLENPCWLLPILLNTCVYSFLLDILVIWIEKCIIYFLFAIFHLKTWMTSSLKNLWS